MPDYTAGKARILLEPQAPAFYTKARQAINASMGGRKLTQAVHLEATTKGFYTDAQAKLAAMRALRHDVTLHPVLSSAFRERSRNRVNQSLQGVYADVTIRGNVDMTRASLAMSEWRKRQEAMPLRIKIKVDKQGVTAGAGALDFRRDMQPIVVPRADTTQMVRDVDKGLEEITRPSKAPKIKPRITFGGLSPSDNPELRRTMQAVQRDLENNFKLRIQPNIGGVQLRLPLGALGFEVIPGAVAAVGSLVAAMHQLSGAALAIPGALAVAGSSISAFAIGIGGLGDAWKAMQAEQERAATQSTTDTDRMTRANDTLRNSQADLRRSQEDLTRARRDARRELEDLNAEQRSNSLSVAEAALDLQRARNELAKGAQGGLEHSENLVREARARETLDRALVRQKRGTEDVTEANQKGISGNDKLVQAQEQVVRSLQAVAEAQRQVAMETRGAANAADKTEYFMKRLSPAGQELLRTLAGMEDKYIAFRNAVQQPMFQGLSQEITTLVNNDMPLVQKGMAGIASAINTNLVTISRSLQTPNNQGFLSRIFGNTEEAQRRLNAFLRPAMDSLLRLGAAGSDAIPRLVTGLANLTNRFSGFLEQADKDGRLDKWIDNGIKGIESLGRSIGNIANIISGVGRAFGGQMFGSLEKFTKYWADWVNSGKGQASMMKFIISVKDTIAAWRPILQDLPKVFSTAMEAGREAIQALLPALNIVTELLEHAPGLITAVVTAFIGWGAIRPIVNTTSLLFTGLATVVTELGSGFAITKSKAEASASGINTAFASVDKAGSGPARAATRIAKFAQYLSVGGPLLGAIGVAAFALSSTLSNAHDDANDAAKRHTEVEKQLADTLDRVTQSAGAASLAMVSRTMQDFQPGNEGLSGNVEEAVTSLGINSTDFLTSFLPGGEQQAAGFMDRFRNEVRGTVLKAAQPWREAFAAKGISDDDLVNAFLGDRAALEKIRNNGVAVPDYGAFSLDRVRDQVTAVGGNVAAAGLAGQFYNDQAPGLRRQQSLARAAQRTATGVQPRLGGPNGLGTQMFVGADGKPLPVEAFYDGRETALRVTNLPPAIAKNLTDRNNRVEPSTPGPNGPVTTIYLTEEDAKQLVSYDQGGPTPGGRGKGPTGGHVVEVHPDEWVLPSPARRALGDKWLWDVTKNKGIPRNGSYELGGPPLIPLAPPVGTGPLPGPPPAPTGPDIAPVPVDPAGVPGVSHAGGPGAPFDPSAAPVVDPGYSQQAAPKVPDFGTALANQFLSPWGMTLDANGAAVPIGGTGPNGQTMDPGTYLGQWAGGFMTSLGSTLIDGVLGFFGISSSNAYVNAFKQTMGFYSDKLGGSGTLDPYTNQLVTDNLNSVNSDSGYVVLPDGTLVSTTATGGPTSGLPGSAVGGVTPSITAGDGTVTINGQTVKAGDVINGVQTAATASTGAKFSGSGVIASPSGSNASEASRARNAVVLPNENIVNWVRSQVQGLAGTKDQPGQIPGLYVGDEGKEGGNPYRGESGSLHEVGRAVDVFGTPEQRRKFIEWWRSDPARAAATRMVIDDNNTDLEMYAGVQNYASYARGQHGDHVHLGLEGVPVSALFGDTGVIPNGDGGTVGGTPGGSGVPPLLIPGKPGQARPGGQNPLAALGNVWKGTGMPSTGGGRGRGRSALPIPGGSDGVWSTSESGPYDRSAAPVTMPGRAPFVVSGGGGGGGLPRPGGGGMAPQSLRRALGARVPKANYRGGNQATYAAVYRAFREAGFSDRQWPALVNIVNRESGWRPTVSNPGSGAYGLFQFLGSTQKAYLPGKDVDPYRQGVAGMRYIRDRYGNPDKAWDFWQKHNWYDVPSGVLPKGLSLAYNATNEDEIVLRKAHAVQAKQIIDRAKQPGFGKITRAPGGAPAPSPGAGRMPARQAAPPPPPEANIPASLPPQGVGGTPVETPAPQNIGEAPADNQYLLPAISKGITQGAAVAGNLAATAASAASAMAGGAGGAAGPLIQGAFVQGGKIVEGLANVGAAFASGFTGLNSSTPNPYGVQLRSNQKPPPLAQDSRRQHIGNNYFADMNDWRKKNQLMDAQDQQAALARVQG